MSDYHICQTFVDNIWTIVDELCEGVSSEELAEETQISSGEIFRLKKHLRKGLPKLETLWRLAEARGMDLRVELS